MDKARRVLDWDAQFDAAIDPEKARRYRQEAKPEKKIPALCAVISVPLRI